MRFVLVCVVALCACGGPEPEHFLWSSDAQSLDNPFPDVRLLTATGAELRADYYRPFLMPAAVTKGAQTLFDRYARDAKTEVHGFGNFNPTLLRTSLPIDPASLAGHFARLRKTASGYEVLERQVAAEHSSASLEGTGKTPGDGFPEFVFVRPAVPLAEGDEGLLVVTAGVKTKDGVGLGRGREWDHDRPALTAAAAALGVTESDIIFALELKAAKVTQPYRDFKTWVDSAAGLPDITIPPKGSLDDGAGMRPVGRWLSTDTDFGVMRRWLEGHAGAGPATHVGQVVVGELAARDPRENGAWNAAWLADPSSAPKVPLKFVLVVPKGTKPAAGWQTVIAQHGINGRNVPVNASNDSLCLQIGEYLSVQGIACLGIDAPSHGTRGSVIDFFNVEHVPVMRENFREMTLDLMQVARAAPHLDIDGDGTPDLDPLLGFFGNSLGSMMGASYVALDPTVKYALLNVPGGGLANVLVSHDNHDRVGLLFVVQTSIVFDSIEYHSTFPLIRAVSQPFLESADPINLFGAMGTDRAVVIQEGLGDQTIPNFTTEDLAASGGLAVPTADVDGTAPIRALYRVDPQRYGMNASYNGHNVFWDIAAPRNQAIAFLTSKGTKFVLPP